ncbi:helix-turn-helix domain-containing protein [Conexibacter sp. SYSU D00693]|uniref:helix-turn-helix domain-containing protein n=1 Tax=Conexibacter sp. SYSU D00693 TaxID=2812560 RepID=UPI00196AC804|nr:XRE family transcriptional regulator [Conexibacter sp. SYSU D00693]
MSANIDADDAGGLQARVAARLRDLRTERGLTLADVAAAAAMDTSTLSRLETGARRLTLDHLPPLARALGVSTDELLGPPPQEDPRIHSAPRKRGGATFWPLNRHPEGPGHHAFKVRLPVRRGTPELRVHPGRDWVYVLSGRLRLVLGDREHVLETGEAAEFDCMTPHALSGVDGPCELLAIFGPHGEEVHVRAVDD